MTGDAGDPSMETCRYRIVLGGAVQGVGFRPFVYRLAHSLELAGYVQNVSDGVVIEVEGTSAGVVEFTRRLRAERPAAASVTSERQSRVRPLGTSQFAIIPSDLQADRDDATGMAGDLATCPECLGEMLDPANRRYHYAFTNCTACGPRFTITEALPYDRPSTTMRGFTMCDACRVEYDTPADRRYHAQPNACPQCGPQLAQPIAAVAALILDGQIVALKGIGGFQLLCDARRADVVSRLRARKARDFKPFALMMPSLGMIERYCMVSAPERAALMSPAAPIVLLRRQKGFDLPEEVCGRSPFVGVMLPYSPLHHLLLQSCAIPVVATSGNVAGEPIAVDLDEAHDRLGAVADTVVNHTRPIARPCDDSVVRVSSHGLSPVRRARGYAPLPVHLGVELPKALAVGGHLKNTIALAVGRDAIVSQHLGDLDAPETRRGFARAIADFCHVHRFTPDVVVADMHPDYASTQWAQASGFPVIQVQHHEAHVAACAAENQVTGPFLGVAWDGAGYGPDGTVWGGEFFIYEDDLFTRIASLRQFPLLGGEAAAREGWRVAMAMDWAVWGSAALEHRPDAPVLERVLTSGLHSPASSSVGRLFDAVAAITGISSMNRFEGESAMALEAAVDPGEGGAYPFGDELSGDWGPLLDAIRDDVQWGESMGAIATRFHRALVGWVCRVAEIAGFRQVVLSGGVFQNAFLSDECVAALSARGHVVHTHHQVPANDGGLSLGQLALSRFPRPLPPDGRWGRAVHARG